MARKPSTHPTDAELEILDILWGAGGPLELGQVVRALCERRGKSVPTTTVATLLGVMLGKGLVQRDGGERSYRWTAAVDPEKTRAGVLSKIIRIAFGGSAPALVANLLGNAEMSEQALKEIRAMLDADAAMGRPQNEPKRGRRDGRRS